MMDFCLIVFASATTANRVKNALMKKYHIKSEIIQTPNQLPTQGCSYSLKFLCEHSDKVWAFVKENGLSSKGIFRENDYHKIK